MKLWFALLAVLFLELGGCSRQPFQSGTVEYIHYRTSPGTSTLLAGEDFKGQIPATMIFRYRSPQVKLYEEYIVISYPGTDMNERVIARDSLIELQWKLNRTGTKP